jgi:hypothetical protein
MRFATGIFFLFAGILLCSTALGVDLFGKTYGGPGTELPATVIREGSKYYLAGNTTSFGAGDADVWIVKVDSRGNVLSEKTYGTSAFESATQIKRTSGKGLIVLGTQAAQPGDVNIWLLKLNKEGAIQWQKSYGGSGNQIGRSIGVTKDKGYIVAGSDESTGAMLVLKLDSKGEVQWQKTFSHSSDVVNGFSIQQTKDNGFILSSSIDNVNNQTGSIGVLKLNEDGDVQWQKTYGPSSSGQGAFISEIIGGYIVSGSIPNNGDDLWVFQLDSDGDVVWQKTYGRPGSSENLLHVRPRGKNFIVAATDNANSAVVMRLGPGGNVIFQREFQFGPLSVVHLDRSKDGGYVFLGLENSELKLHKTDKNARIASGCGPGNSDFVTADTSIVPGNGSLISAVPGVVPGATSGTTGDTVAAVNQDCGN